MSHFKLLCATKASDVIPVSKYFSEKTGLTVIIAETEGPLVNGFFCLATEAHDDDGLPHTLEHLIFLGSKKYPYKGILDLLANRCLAQGTNAWTDVDHTCYTIETAGDAGMITLLPIYLDHILNPTLTEQGFLTEVHHIDENGDDAGVVYCEMQGRENNADSRCELRLLRAMYPNSGYSSETGGIMENLRTSCNNKKVTDFHKKFYRPENLTIILTGQIAADDVFKALAVVEDDIIAKREKESLEEWVKPWQTLPPPPVYTEMKEQWPADTEDCGQVLFGWRGPVLLEPNAMKDMTACSMLLRYLCDTAAAPLQRRLVERDDALAGDVSYNLTENIATYIKIELDNVPVDKLEAARDEAKKCLAAVRSGEEPIDMERVRRLARKQLREHLALLEADPNQTVTFRCIGDALYSQNDQDFVSRMNPQEALQELMEESLEYWLGLMKRYFTDDMIVIVGSPSIELQAKMAEEEKKRIEAQRAELGEAGLAEKAKMLDEATEFNSRPPPPGTLAGVPVPPSDQLKCHALSSWSAGEPCPHFDLAAVPLYTRLHSLNTNFVYINLVLDTTEVSQDTRKWTPLLLNSLAECPVRRGDKLIPHEEIISTTEQLTVMLSSVVGFGAGGNFSVGACGNFVVVAARCETQDYEAVVNHLYEVLYEAEITKERLLVFAQRLINDVAQVRRDGHKMTSDTLRDALYSKDSNMHWCSVLRQQKFLKELVERLNAGGDAADAAVAEAKQHFRHLTSAPWLHLAADLVRYKLSTEPWQRFARVSNEVDPTPKPPKLYMDAELMSGWGGGCVVGVGGVESAFVLRASPGPRGPRPGDLAPLLVALKYFTQLEGPMWQLIRGAGLAYSYGLRVAGHEARIMFSLYRASNAVQAYIKAKSIIHVFLAAGYDFDEDLFVSAKSAALFDAVELVKAPAELVDQSLFNYVRQYDNQYNSKLISAIAAVTRQDALQAARAWLPTLFDDGDASKISVVCHPSKVTEMQANFNKIGLKLESFESIELSHFNK